MGCQGLERETKRNYEIILPTEWMYVSDKSLIDAGHKYFYFYISI